MKTFLAGLGAGIALGVLYAPQSGHETRGQIRSKANKLVGRAKQQTGKVQQLAGRVQELAGSVQQKVSRTGASTRDVGAGPTSKTRGAGLQGEEEEDVFSQAGQGLLSRLNSASRDELMSISGIGPVTADKIIRSRPYNSAEQVVDRGIVPESVFKEMRKKFTAA
jgi:DNA uptake protein ComE-like DNA-binding protein